MVFYYGSYKSMAEAATLQNIHLLNLENSSTDNSPGIGAVRCLPTIFTQTMDFNLESPFEILVLRPLYKSGSSFHFQITFLNFTAVLDFEKHLSSCKVSWSWQFHKISPQYPISCSNSVSYCQI